MNKSNHILRTFLGVTAAAGLAMLASGMFSLAMPTGTAGANEAGYGHGWGYGHAMRDHGDYGQPCGRIGLMTDRLDRIVGIMGLDETQQATWDDLADTAKSAATKVSDACGARDDRDATAPERMARMEDIMAASLEGVRAVRPKFEAFYAGLSTRQQQALDDLMSHRGHHARMRDR